LYTNGEKKTTNTNDKISIYIVLNLCGLILNFSTKIIKNFTIIFKKKNLSWQIIKQKQKIPFKKNEMKRE